MSDTYNIEICPECEASLDVTHSFNHTEEESPGPLQGHWLACTECDHETVIAILHYPDGEYEGITEAVDEVCGECDAEAMWRVKRNTGRLSFFCDDCVYDLFSESYRDAVRELVRWKP